MTRHDTTRNGLQGSASKHPRDASSAQQTQQQSGHCRSPARHWTSRCQWDENPPSCCPVDKGKANHPSESVESTQQAWHGMSRHHSIFRIPPDWPSNHHVSMRESKAGARVAAKQSQAAPAQSLSSRPQTNRTRYKLLCWALVGRSRRNKHWPAHLMSPAVHHPVLLRDWVVIRSRPSAPCLLVPAPRLLWRRFSCARCFTSSHLFPWSCPSLCPPANSLSNPGTRLHWAAGGRAGNAGKQDWIGAESDWTWRHENSMILMSIS